MSTQDIARQRGSALDNSVAIRRYAPMTTRLALILALLIAGFFALDHFVFEWGAGVFALKKLMELIAFLAFWR